MHSPSHRQGGVTLVVVLVFLVIIALLGVTVATVTTLEERMAGNTRSRDLAFQAAEAALADAQVRLTQTGVLLCNNAKVQTYVANDNSPSYWATQFGAADGTVCTNCFTPDPALSTGAGKIVHQPEYLIHKKPSDSGGAHARHYVVTARGMGGTTDAIVILQAEYTCDDSSCSVCTP